MSRQFWQESLVWSTTNGAQISNTTVETIVFPNTTIPANYLQDGRVLRITAMGKFSNVVTTPGTLTFRFRWGALPSGTILSQTAGISLNATAQTDIMWRLTNEIVTRSNGATGTLLSMGMVELGAQLAASNNQPNLMGSAGAGQPAAITVDLTVDTPLVLSAQFSVSTSPTNLTGMNLLIESLT
jgi:hypothetical protein